MTVTYPHNLLHEYKTSHPPYHLIHLPSYNTLPKPGCQSGGTLKPIGLPEIMQAQQEEVRRVIWEESAGPLEHVRLYDKYAPLVSQQAQDDVEQFLREQHSFPEIMIEVTRYQQLADEIQYSSSKVWI